MAARIGAVSILREGFRPPLLVSQRLDRVHAGGAAGGEDSGEDADGAGDEEGDRDRPGGDGGGPSGAGAEAPSAPARDEDAEDCPPAGEGDRMRAVTAQESSA